MRGYYIFARGGQSVTLILKGRPYTVASDNGRYAELVEAIKADDWDAIEKIVEAAASYGPIIDAFGDVTVYGGHVVYQGRELHNYLVTKIIDFHEAGLPLDPLGRFMQNVLRNPDRRAQDDLYDWCERAGLPITSDGCIIAYKAVRPDYLDHHSRTIDHTPGQVPEMDRDACDPDPATTCSRGLHFCAASYLASYVSNRNSRILLLKINPADVVAFPRDAGGAKGRACRYEVIEEIPPETVDEHFDGVQGYYEPPIKAGDYVKLNGTQMAWAGPKADYLYRVASVDGDTIRIWIGNLITDYDYPLSAFDKVEVPQ